MDLWRIVALYTLVAGVAAGASSGHNQHRSCKVCSESIALQHCKWQCGEEHLESRYGKIDGYESKANANGSCLLLLFEPNCTNFTLSCQQNDGTKTHEVAQYHCEDSSRGTHPTPNTSPTDYVLYIVGVTVTVAVVIVCLIVYCLCKRRKKEKTPTSNTDNDNASRDALL